MDETRIHLEMLAPNELRPSALPDAPARLVRVEPPDARLSRSLYENVGRDWNWVDRLAWTDEEWMAYLSQPGIQTWVLFVEGQPAGYFELAPRTDGSVEIAYFGLMPNFIGRGLGGYLLTEAVRRAWAIGASRVWLHTSSRDHPHALANYQARGFRVFKTERL